MTFTLTADGILGLTLEGVRYAPVYCRPLFPVTRPEEYVAVFQTKKDKKKGVSLGVIRTLADLPAKQQNIVRDDLRLAHFLPAITRVKAIKSTAKGQYWEVVTDRGEKSFVVKHSGESTAATIQGVIIITDRHGFRYRISDMDNLDKKSRAELIKAQL